MKREDRDSGEKNILTYFLAIIYDSTVQYLAELMVPRALAAP